MSAVALLAQVLLRIEGDIPGPLHSVLQSVGPYYLVDFMIEYSLGPCE